MIVVKRRHPPPTDKLQNFPYFDPLSFPGEQDQTTLYRQQQLMSHARRLSERRASVASGAHFYPGGSLSGGTFAEDGDDWLGGGGTVNPHEIESYGAGFFDGFSARAV